MFQDNQSNMRLVVNGKNSNFFMHDIIKHQDMPVKYSPTGDMWADVITKFLQGQAFCKIHSKLMNIPIVCVEDETPVTPSSAQKSTGVQVHSKTGVTEHKPTGVHWGKPIITTCMHNTEGRSRNREI